MTRVYRGHAQKNLFSVLSRVEVLVVFEVPRRYNLVVGLGLMKRRRSLLLMGRSGGRWKRT